MGTRKGPVKNGQLKRAEIRAEQGRFLEAYRTTATIVHAATLSGVYRQRHYDWLSKDEEYAERFAEEEERATEVLESEARRRAVDGVEEPVGWHQGKAGGYVKRYSDVLLIFLLKGARPEKYRDRSSVDVNVGNMPNVRIEYVKPEG